MNIYSFLQLFNFGELNYFLTFAAVAYLRITQKSLQACKQAAKKKSTM